MSIDIVPFYSDLIPDAGALLAERHRRDRLALSELPPRFEEPAVAARAVETLLQRQRASGVAALRDGQLAAYLIGEMVVSELWGRSGWVRQAGCAVAPGESVELVRNLYATLGQGWVAQGCFFHFALAPVADPALVHAWFSLSFGIEQVYALADLAQLDLQPPALPPGVELRRAGPADKAVLAGLSDVIWRHQVQAPVWGIMLPETVGEQQEGWAELTEDPDVAVWLAYLDGEPVGCQGYWLGQPGDDDLLTPEAAAELSVAGTRPHVRGRGIATALTQHGLLHAREAGYRYSITDWRSTNLLASRFWPRRGFRPMVYRLVRRIDPRIAWANPSAQVHSS